MKQIYTYCIVVILMLFRSQETAAQCSVSITGSRSLNFCKGETINVKLSASIAAAKSYQWLLNDQPITGADKQEYEAKNPGKYSVTVKDKDDRECKAETEVKEIDLPTLPAFTFTPAGTECGGTSINFTINAPQPDVTYTWNFGNNTTKTGETVTFAFDYFGNNTQNFPVSVIATNAFNCTSNEVTQTVTVKGTPEPILKDIGNPFAEFSNCSNSPTAANPDYTLQVSNASQVKAEITGYKLDWGDGSAIETLPADFTGSSHTYKALGEFKLKFTATSVSGCSYTKEYKVVNQSNPAVGLASFGSTEGCAPLNLKFQLSKYEANSPGTIYIWDFGDDTPNITWDYNEPSKNDIIEHSFTTTSCGKPNNEFKVTVTAINGCRSTVISVGSITVFNKPKPKFTLNKGVGCTGTAFEITNGSELGGYGSNCSSTTTFTLNWGDGTPPVTWNSQGSPPPLNQSFQTKGKYEVTLTAQNGCGEEVYTQGISIIEPAKANFAVSTLLGCVNEEIKMGNSSTGDSLQYKWSIEPDQGYTVTSGSLTDANPSFTFSQPGAYTITLLAYNGCTESVIIKPLIIKGLPVALLPTSPTYCGPQKIKFDASNPKHTPFYTSNGGTITSYLWEIDNTAATFEGGTSATSEFPEINFPTVGRYTVGVTITTECGNSEKATQIITIQSAPDAPVITDVTVCSGATATLTATGSNGSYNWYAVPSEGSPIQTGNTTFITSPLTADATYYVEAVSTENCPSPRVPVKVTVNPAVGNNTIATEQIICTGSLPGALTGTPPTGGDNSFVYQWEISSDGITFATAPGTSNEISYTPDALTQTTWFKRIVTSGTCSLGSNIIAITVEQPIANNTVTGDQVICSGQSAATLAGPIPTGGSGLYSYQWQRSNDNSTFTDIGAATDSSFSPGVLTQTTYFRRIARAGLCAENISNNVTVTVNPAHANNVVSDPQIICRSAVPNPLSGTLPSGGDGTFIYEWESSTESATSGFAVATGATDQQSYTPQALSQTTWFRRKITSGGCTTLSNTIEVKVLEIINNNSIITAPETICQGSPAPTLQGSEPAGGNNVYTYLWQYSTTGATQGFKEGPGTNQTKDYQPGVLTEPTWFRRVVMAGPCTADTSAAIKIEINVPISQNTITGGNPEVCAGDIPVALTGTLPQGGNGAYTYVWEVSTVSATTGFATAPGLNTEQNYSPEALSQTTWFRRVVVSAPCSPDYSSAIKIDVLPGITDNTLSGNQEVCEGSAPAKITGALPGGGNGTFAYLWQSSNDNQTFTAASGINNEKDYTPPVLIESVWYRRVVTSGPACSNNSEVVLITVNKNLADNTISTDQFICGNGAPDQLIGSNPTGGNGNYVYLWEMSQDNINFEPASGTNNLSDYLPASLPKTTWFRRKITAGPCVSSFSNTVKISIGAEVANNVISKAQRICEGTLVAPLTGSNPTGGDGTYTYTWEMSTTGPNTGFIAAPGVADGATYNPGYITQTAWYRRTVLSGGCSLTSRPVQIIVDAVIANNTISTSQLICYSSVPDKIIGTVPQGGNGVFTYTWEYSTDSLNFSPAPGINATVDFQPPLLTGTVWYRRIVSSLPCSQHESNIVKIKVVEKITNNTITAAEKIVCYNASPTLTGSAPGGSTGKFTYLWEASTIGLTSGFQPAEGMNNAADYTPPPLTQTTWFRRIVLALPCAELVSAALELKVKPLPASPVANNIIICPGTSGSVTASGPADAYQWYDAPENGTLLHTGSTFTTPALTATTSYFVQSIVDGCPSLRKEVKVQVYPVAVTAGPDVTIIAGKTIDLVSSGGVKFRWSPAIGLSDTTVAIPQASPAKTTTYKVTITTSNGCVATDEVTVTVLPLIQIANGITPNGDGHNDEWLVKNIEYYPEAEVEIYNRWGNKIFSSQGDVKPWDGKYNGQDLPVAAYYYIIRLNKEEKPLAGSITLVR